MSISKTVMSAVMAFSLVAVPTLASAAPVAKTTAVSARVGAPSVQGKKAVGGGLIIALLAAAAVIGGIVIAADSGKSSTSR